MAKPSNKDISNLLRDIADLLYAKGGNEHRIRSYRRAADSLVEVDSFLAETVQSKGAEALKKIPGVGKSLAGLIAEYVTTGKSALHDRLWAEVSPMKVFEEIGGVGSKLAKRIVQELGIETLEELEVAAHDGRLAELSGFGPKRVQTVKDSLAGRLSRSSSRKATQRLRDKEGPGDPPIDLLLELDEEYRRKAEKGSLRTIAPKRFNPSGKAWLPILSKKRNGWKFTILFSNTARAHELESTHDWVVIYFEKDGLKDQCAVVTKNRGTLQGMRVVRGRERECRKYYGESEDG